MNEAREDAFGATMNGKIYVAVGKTCEVYNPSTNEWQLITTALNVPRHSASMVCFQGSLFVLKGLKDDESRELSVEMFDPEANA